MAPPSRHPETGKVLEWIAPPKPPTEALVIHSLKELEMLLAQSVNAKWVLEELFESARKIVADEAVLKAWLEKIRAKLDVDGEGPNYLYCHCPFHKPDKNPSFAIHKAKYYAVDYHDNRIFNLKQLAEALNINLEGAKEEEKADFLKLGDFRLGVKGERVYVYDKGGSVIDVFKVEALAGEGVKRKLAKLTGVDSSVVSKCVAELLQKLEEREEEPVNPLEAISEALNTESSTLHPLIDFNQRLGLVFACPITAINSFPQAFSQTAFFVAENVFALPKRGGLLPEPFAIQVSFKRAKWLGVSRVCSEQMLLVASEYFKNSKIDFPPKNVVFEKVVGGIKYYWYHSEEGYYTLVACWAIGTWFHLLFNYYPILNPQGERETGKTTLLEILAKVCWNPTPRECALREAGLFRTIEDSGPTYIMDVTKLDPRNKNYTDVIDVCEAGTEKGGVVKRVNRETGEPMIFQVYSPKAIATRYELPFVAKCIRIISEKAQDKKYAQRRHMLEHDEIWKEIVGLCFKAALKYWHEVKEAYESLQPTDKLYGRFFNYWAPLLAVCKVFAPNKYDELLKLAEEYAETQTVEDALAEVETAILTVLIGFDSETLTITLKELTEKVKGLVPWIKDWHVVKSALENLRVVKRKYNTKNGVTYQLNLEEARKEASGRIQTEAAQENQGDAQKQQQNQSVLTKENVEHVLNALVEASRIRGSATTREVALEANMPVEAVKAILEALQREGRVHQPYPDWWKVA